MHHIITRAFIEREGVPDTCGLIAIKIVHQHTDHVTNTYEKTHPGTSAASMRRFATDKSKRGGNGGGGCWRYRRLGRWTALVAELSLFAELGANLQGLPLHSSPLPDRQELWDSHVIVRDCYI